MNNSFATSRGFSLVELLVVIAIIGLLAILLVPALGLGKSKAGRTTCANNLRQITLGMRMYSDDSQDATPSPGTEASTTNVLSLYSGYKQLINHYVGAHTGPASLHRLFACPADAFYPNIVFNEAAAPAHYVRKSLHDEPYVDFSSYSFNGGDNLTETIGTHAITRPGLTGVRLGAVKHPARTVLVAEASALTPWSWHEPSPELIFNDAKNVVGFVDGHVRYLRIYWDANRTRKGLAAFYDPPPDYAYQWSPN